MSDLEKLKNKLAHYGQLHLLEFWDEINEDERKELFEDLSEIDFEDVTNLFRRAMESRSNAQEKADERLQPIPADRRGSITKTSPAILKSYEDAGMEQIANGAVAVLLLAGGQGTRLGVPYPKGMYDVGLPSRKTLYQIQAERIQCLERLALERFPTRNHNFEDRRKSGLIPWFVMTSEHTKEATQDFFAQNNYFGLNPEDVIIFEQGMLPCFTESGKIILESRSRVAKAPDGNGGLYKALKDNDILSKMESHGIQYVHVYGVDNILVRVGDPVFLGYCLAKGADCGAKAVEKAFPTEAVGVFCVCDGHYEVVEYSEISLETAQRRNKDGMLTFGAGNICNHFFTVKFLWDVIKKHGCSMRLHVARRKIKTAWAGSPESGGEPIVGLKLEKFVFDVFWWSQHFATWEVRREDEFSALKNSDGAPGAEPLPDTPTSARRAYFSLHLRWILAAGGSVVDQQGNPVTEQSTLNSTLPCEVSPLVSYGGEGLKSLVDGKVFKLPILLSVPQEDKHHNDVLKNHCIGINNLINTTLK
ncbi:UDP-N-acetylhexosamine pyrophosphorylase-like protein 1 [Ischnura elegans]|uniref:UDP-N-acetylhexosamine pyrophosphorylase-like protein 1 n=1 Tax=Ischnura elegans TaxID=197161 RepID=UPI001ED86F26|nr:UDP-N-acetylhexosamine pyrophosphorylase-like protein 1 [Ischnura elegans]